MRRLFVRGLEAAYTYALTDLDTAQVIQATGAALMTTGFDADLHDRTSALLSVRVVEEVI